MSRLQEVKSSRMGPWKDDPFPGPCCWHHLEAYQEAHFYSIGLLFLALIIHNPTRGEYWRRGCCCSLAGNGWDDLWTLVFSLPTPYSTWDNESTVAIQLDTENIGQHPVSRHRVHALLANLGGVRSAIDGAT